MMDGQRIACDFALAECRNVVFAREMPEPFSYAKNLNEVI
jgi:hypothetical protein